MLLKEATFILDPRDGITDMDPLYFDFNNTISIPWAGRDFVFGRKD